MKKAELISRLNKNLAGQVFRVDSQGFLFSKTIYGDLYLGDGTMLDRSATFMKDTPENRKHMDGLFECWSFGRELKI